MKSRYKHLVASGCSFTTNEHVPDKSDYAWPNILARDTGMTIHNLATSGAGNQHISKSIMVYLERENLPTEDTLVIAMWSGVGRIDFAVSADLDPRPYYPWNYYYTPQCRLQQGGHWWNLRKDKFINRMLIDYTKFQDDFTMALDTWLAMTSLSSYLKARNVCHYFTSFLHYGTNKIYFDAAHVDLDHTLAKMNLKIDYSDWLDLAPCDYFGDWCRDRKLITDDGFHPGLEGPLRWPAEVLMPLLKSKGVLYDA